MRARRGRSVRIIPAHAGFTATRARHGTQRQDHPRTRGVYSQSSQSRGSSAGSSPHTRGLRVRGDQPATGIRIIPAHAGFTSTHPRRHHLAPDHPRTRGVYVSSGPHQARSPGSSPHTRGLLARQVREDLGGRIIPAHAGFTGRTARRSRRAGDHPRTRGVYQCRLRPLTIGVGSSPHTRGLHLAILGIPTVLESTTPRFPSLLT